jgi:hypothetical protein
MTKLKEMHGITMDWIYAGDASALPFSLARVVLRAVS